MAVRLRTRLFLVVAALLGASIAVSALLSRRATLVEVHSVVNQVGLEDPLPILDRVASECERRPPAELAASLAAVERETARRVLVIDTGRRVVAASNATLAAAHVSELTVDGTFRAELGSDTARSVVQIHGAPVRSVTGAAGRPLTIVLLPPEDRGDAVPGGAGAPMWVWTTIATGLIAVPLVFAVARRILDPITALTGAAHRMQAGDLDVRVDVRGRDELADLARAFNGMATRVAENERLRQQMMTDVAHELRSPVTNLRCTLESIQDGLASSDRASIDALHEETLFLQRLIGDLQDLTLADAGRLSLRLEPVELRSVIRRALPPATAGGEREVRVDIPDGLPAVNGDADRLEQVFRNLISNAVTHTSRGGVVAVRVRSDRSLVHIEVSDNGRGIDPAHLPHVFDRFYRADQSHSRATGGAGLGLAIVRQLVASHRGTVSAASEGPGRGARFTVTLPVANLQ